MNAFRILIIYWRKKLKYKGYISKKKYPSQHKSMYQVH